MKSSTIGTWGALTLLMISHLLAATPRVRETAPEFALKSLDEKEAKLSEFTARGPVVLVVLRGWPGYQCPICTKQVHDYVAHASAFEQKGATVVMVYPGPADQLKAHAAEFLADKSWPAKFVFLLDPDYAFVETYDLRWRAEKETAFPSTFVLGRGGKVALAEVSHTHGGRVSAERALQALDAAETPASAVRAGSK